jgi:hypothetical protein
VFSLRLFQVLSTRRTFYHDAECAMELQRMNVINIAIMKAAYESGTGVDAHGYEYAIDAYGDERYYEEPYPVAYGEERENPLYGSGRGRGGPSRGRGTSHRGAGFSRPPTRLNRLHPGLLVHAMTAGNSVIIKGRRCVLGSLLDLRQQANEVQLSGELLTPLQHLFA